MQLIKARFLRGGEPYGRTYTYQTNEPVEIGDTVQLNEQGIGVVVETDVSESEVEAFKDRLKTIIGRIKPENKEAGSNPHGVEPFE